MHGNRFPHRGFERVKLTNLTEEQAATFAVRRHLFSGVDIQEALSRYYPFGEQTAHAIGYVSSISEQDLQRIDRSNYAGTSHIGKTGIERSYEDRLHGQVGYRQIEVNAQGRVVEGAAGVPVAAFRQVATDYANKTVAIVLCGANVSPAIAAMITAS